MKVYEKLISSILSGDLLPGDRLREIDLAKRLNVSRTPVREAMRRLEADGLITHKPRIGAEVRTLTQEEIVELYEMRIVLEAPAAKMAAKHASNSEISILED
ncbi:MAG: GntR family transcriptional regulator, partial [Paracoccaceae bacterium]